MYRSVVPAIVADVAPRTLISVGSVAISFDTGIPACPAGHARDTHALAPADEDVPAGQLTHALAPAPAEYVPAVQFVQALAPAAENDPAVQLIHAVDPAPAEYDPAVQFAHDEAPEAAVK